MKEKLSNHLETYIEEYSNEDTYFNWDEEIRWWQWLSDLANSQTKVIKNKKECE